MGLGPEVTAEDKRWLELALEQAGLAEAEGEVPVGALLVKDGELIAASYNQPIGAHDPTAHAEVRVLRQAAQKLNNYRLPGTTLYVTLEPCPMCASAMVHARVERVVFACVDPRTGACGSVINLAQSDFANHRINVVGPVTPEYGEMLRKFFRERR